MPQPEAQPENHPQEGGGEHRLPFASSIQHISRTEDRARAGAGRGAGIRWILQVFQQLWGHIPGGPKSP